MMTAELISRLKAEKPIIEETGAGYGIRQHAPGEGPQYLRVSLRPFGRLGHVLWLHTDTMQAQLEMTGEQVRTLKEMLERYESEVLDGS